MNTSGNYTFREVFTKDSILDFYHLDKEVLPSFWSQESWENLKFDLFHLYGAFETEKLVGFLLCDKEHEKEYVYIHKVVVAFDHRFKKIGSGLLNLALMRVSMTRILGLSLEVSCENEGGIKFYQRLGFKSIGRRESFYSNGEDAYSMVKE